MDRSTKIGTAAVGAIAAALAGALLLVPEPSQSDSGFAPIELPTDGSAASVALFIGDSYTAGTGSSGSDKRWTTIVASEMGWQETNAGVGGTGYTSTAGPEGCGLDFCPNYQAVAKESAAEDADIVVVAGGQNDFDDWATNRARVTKAVGATYKRLRKDHPDATIVAVGPSDVDQAGVAARGVDAVVRAAAKDVDARYISLLKPPTITSEMVLDDGGHVNDAGHAAIAKRVLSKLEK